MKNLLKRLSLSLLLGANICTILLLWLCVALTFISPHLLPRLSLLTLAFPVFLAANTLFLIFWLLFHARLAWVPIAAMLPAAGYILDYCPLHLTTDNNATPGQNTLTIITYNVGRMTTEEGHQELLSFLTTADADIVCLQELSQRFLRNNNAWLDSAGYHTLQISNLAVLSRHPFLSDTISIHYPTRSNHSFACWIDLDGDSLLLVNNHLESNHLNPEEKDEYTNAITDPHRENIKKSSHLLVGKLSQAAAYRGPQADSISTFVRNAPTKPIIVCGDLNETPVSYTYQRLAQHLHSAYREAGKGPGFTYTHRSFPVRIDHLFFSDDWTCNACRIDRTVSLSDHYPLVVQLSKKTR